MNENYKNESWLREQYLVYGKTIQSLCDKCGVSHYTIEKYLRKFNIRKLAPPVYPAIDELRELHLQKGYGIRKISDMYPGVGAETIRRLMLANGVEPLSPAVLRSKWWQNSENKSRMSTERLLLWKDDDYRSKVIKHLSDECAIKSRSEKYSATYQGVSMDEWSGFLTPKQTRLRNTAEYVKWRTSVFDRDNYTCQCCGAKSSKGNPVELQAHHIENFAHNKELRFDVGNGITLCYNCHDVRSNGSFHNICGVRGNNRAQLTEYLRSHSALGKNQVQME